MGTCNDFWGDPHAPLFTWKNRWTRVGLAALLSTIILIVIVFVATGGKTTNDASPETVTATTTTTTTTTTTKPTTMQPATTTMEPEPPSVPDIKRFDCTPDIQSVKVTKEDCMNRGCVFAEDTVRRISATAPDPTPQCYFSEDWVNYDIQQSFTNPDGSIVALLKKTSGLTGLIDDIPLARVEVTPLDEFRIRIKITDVASSRWEPPFPSLNIPPTTTDTKEQEARLYDHSIDKDGNLSITRKENGVVVFSTNIRKLIFADQFIQLIVNTPSNELYGLGEHYDTHLKKVETKDDKAERKRFIFHTFKNYDTKADIPSYGHHPFYMMYEEGGESHGVWLNNINSGQIIMTSTPALTYRVIGGVLDFFVFMGPTPDQVIQQKQDLIGHSPLPPLWALGFHLCRLGSNSLDEVKKIYGRNIEAGLPLDAQWIDIDYMDNFNIFTYDKDKFKDLPQFVNDLHKEGRRLVPILEPHIDGSEDKSLAGWTVFKDGSDKDIFIRNPKGGFLKGKIGYRSVNLTVFPDFTNPKCHDWWIKHIKKFHQKVNFDGLWIDMNEPTAAVFSFSCHEDKYDSPQFNPLRPLSLEYNTICMSGKQYLGPHYNHHNMYGTFQAQATFNALKEVRKKRPFILSRATSTGAGSFTSHWTGDVNSDWESLRMSISRALEFGLFGIPMTGADICGPRIYSPSLSKELCARWSSVGAFYTLARYYYTRYQTLDQDPASPKLGGKDGIVFRANMYALERRYALLPYLYSLFFKNSLTGDPVLRSLRFNFPKETSLADNDYQFMWGKSLMINAILDKGKTGLQAQFPPGKWYDMEREWNVISANETRTKMLSIPLGEINLSVRGGSILPLHDPQQSTTDQRKELFKLWVYLDDEKRAFGELYWDEGDSLNTKKLKEYSHIEFTCDKDSFTSRPLLSNYRGEPYTDSEGQKLNTMRVKEVKIFGLNKEVKKVKVGNQDVTFTYDPLKRMLVIPHDASKEWSTSLLEEFQITWEA